MRETWAETCDEFGTPIIAYKADNETYLLGPDGILDPYKCHWSLNNYPANGKWKSPLFMPKKYSRITLEITDIRVEKLKDITREDAICEGVRSQFHYYPIQEFSLLWNKINSKRGYGWHINPYVWVIFFKRIK